MGEVVSLQEYKDKLAKEKIEREVEELQACLQRIIEEYDIKVENLPYFEYDTDNQEFGFMYMFYVTPPDFY